MALDFKQLLNLDLSYPGISFGYESWALDSYLQVLEHQISHARESLSAIFVHRIFAARSRNTLRGSYASIFRGPQRKGSD